MISFGVYLVGKFVNCYVFLMARFDYGCWYGSFHKNSYFVKKVTCLGFLLEKFRDSLLFYAKIVSRDVGRD